MVLPWATGCTTTQQIKAAVKLDENLHAVEKGMQVVGAVLSPLTAVDAAMQKRREKKREKKRRTAIRRAISKIVDKPVDALTSEDFESIETLVVNSSELTDLTDFQNTPNLK